MSISDPIDIINFIILIMGVTVSVGGLLLSVVFHNLQKREKNFFIILFITMIIYTGFELLTSFLLLSGKAEFTSLTKLSVYISSLASSNLMPMLSTHISQKLERKSNKRKLFLGQIAALWVIYLIILAFAQFTDYIYYFTPDNTYHRGPYYPLLLIPAVMIMIANLIAIIRQWPILRRRERTAYILYIAAPLVAMLIQIRLYGILVIVLGSVISSVFMFYFVLKDQVELFVMQTKVNAEQRAKILALQMRPHFIYNTLTSIYYLCDQDTEKAKSTILNFTMYLRKNLTAMSAKELISFNDELEHTKAYLYVEQVRFDEHIKVEYDTPFTDFRIPALTMQPLVENAVKHGLDPNGKEPLVILIKTEKTPSEIVITVENSGSFVKESDKDDPHIALDNIKQRLAMLCNGTLEIISRDRSRTLVTIKIPAGNQTSSSE